MTTLDERSAVQGIGIAFPIVATLLVAARFWVRCISTTLGLSWDDWASLVGLFGVYFTNFPMVWGAFNNGVGLVLLYYDTLTQYYETEKILYISTLAWIVTIGIIKIAVLLLYKRIFLGKKFNLAANILLVISTLWVIASVLALIFSYSPVQASYTPIPDARLNINIGALMLSVDCIDIVLDLAVLSLPVSVVRKLQVSTKKKVMICGVFLIGLVSVISSIVRIPYHLNEYSLVGTTLSPDEFAARNYATKDLIWCMLEVDLGLIALCLPTLGPLIRQRRRQQQRDAKKSSYDAARRMLDGNNADDRSGPPDPMSLSITDIEGGAVSSDAATPQLEMSQEKGV